MMHPRTLALVCLLGLALAISSCPRAPVEVPPAPDADLVWPGPPAPARIRYLRTVAVPDDLGIRRHWWQRAAELFTGAQPQGMVRPVAVAASGDTLIVADPGLPAVHVFAKGRYRAVKRVGDEKLVSPVGVAATAEGEIFIADSARAKIFRMDGAGRDLGWVEDEELRRPTGLAWSDREQRLYVSDTLAHRILTYDRDGRRLTAFGGRGAGTGGFNYPGFLAHDGRGKIFVSDALNFRVIALAAETGEFAWSFGAAGDGSGNLARPKGVAVDSHGHVYVADALFDAVQIFDSEGRFLLAFGEQGGRSGQFLLPTGLYIDADDRIYVADSYNRRVQVFQYIGSESL